MTVIPDVTPESGDDYDTDHHLADDVAAGDVDDVSELDDEQDS